MLERIAPGFPQKSIGPFSKSVRWTLSSWQLSNSNSIVTTGITGAFT